MGRGLSSLQQQILLLAWEREEYIHKLQGDDRPIGCVPPFTHSVVSRAVQLMMPTVS